MILKLPTALTWMRILLIPVLVIICYLPDPCMVAEARNWVAAGVFVLAAVTDWFDGYLARALNATSKFGAFLDPVADKLIVAAALIVLVDLERTNAIFAMIIIGREITISALREWMAQLGQMKSVTVAMIGKIKTGAQMVAITALLLYEPILPWISTVTVGTIAMWIAVLLTIGSMLHYLRLAMPHIRETTLDSPSDKTDQ
ncbi:MAG: CDP-diacylglycerol--glycerol-3-phosphate 3-phosphatidyltransferase [Burkholderiales bacterium]|jgi:CDP-diacylglycerol--glycerol-3-phosphate 3-phosphatidyltransferase/cardiolipin synthase|nr:CDP-diacylglycerol--glycerol-3-phosphate 3-phosphatidyltransferase [Burkholderiales bacterium]